MDSVLLQLGVGGIFAVLIIREFVNLVAKLKGKNGNGNGSQTLSDIKQIAIDTNDKTKALHSLHSKTDGDGVPMVYSPRSIVADQKEMAKTQNKTAEHMRDISMTQTQMADTMKEIKEKVSH